MRTFTDIFFICLALIPALAEISHWKCKSNTGTALDSIPSLSQREEDGRLWGFFTLTVSVQRSRKSSYLFIADFLLGHFLAVFLAGLEGSGINGVQTLSPLPVESALLLFAAPKTKPRCMIGS